MKYFLYPINFILFYGQYFYNCVIFGKDLILSTKDEDWLINPRAVRNLFIGVDYISFDCTVNGQVENIKIKLNKITDLYVTVYDK